MPKTLIGLDIGTTAVRAAELRAGEPRVLTRFAQLTVPPGTMVNGEVSDPEALTALLKDLWRRGQFRSRRVAIAVANPGVVVRQVDVPEMEENDLRGALPYQVQDYIPMPIDETYLDSLVLDRFVAEDGAPMMRVLAVAAQRAMVDKAVEVLLAAGLEPDAIDVGPLAAVRALVEPVPAVMAEREAEAIVDIGGGITNVVVHEHGTPRFVRILAAGGNDITAALVNELGMTPEDAEATKIHTGLQVEGAEVPSGAATVIEQRARAFIDDVRRSLEYYSAQPDAERLARVLLTGGGSQLPHLADRLAGAIHLPVEQADALTRLQIGDLGLDADQLSQVSIVAAVAVGTALEE